MSDTTFKFWILLCISKDYSPSIPFLKEKLSMVIIAPTDIYLHVYVVYMYIIPIS
jgi:hypothetical protein